MSMYSSTALSLYKYWHVYYTPDGAMFAPSNSCYTREVGVLNFFGNQSIKGIIGIKVGQRFELGYKFQGRFSFINKSV